MSGLRKDGPMPLYVQLKDVIRRAIEAGQWSPGEKIPSEDVLAGRFSVSKITVRQALRDLSDLGYVRREQGRGTFVQHPKLAQGPRDLTSFSEEMRRHGWKASSRALSQGIVPAPEEVAMKLKLQNGDNVFRLRRLRLADREPMGIQTAWLPAAVVPGIERISFQRVSLYEALRARFGLSPANARERHSAIVLNRADALLLGVPARSPAIASERVSFLDDGTPLEYVQSVMRGDRYSIMLDLVRDFRSGQ
jgi:GntR family transcriptional regulator